MKKRVWWTILLAARKAFPAENEFLREDLADVIGSTPEIASGWLSKFVTWGYVKHAGTQSDGTSKWRRLYKLTEHGMTRREPEGRMDYREKK